MDKRMSIPVAVIGAGMIPFGELFEKSISDMIVGAYEACLASVDKGFDEKEIQAAWLAIAQGSLFRFEQVSGSTLSQPLALRGIPVTRVENMCASGSDAIRNAAFAIAAGFYDVVLVVGAEKMRDVPPRDSLIALNAEISHLWWHPRGMTAPMLFGQYGAAHMKEFGTKREHFGMVAVKNHKNGILDPYAHLRFAITLDQVLKAPLVSWPLGLYDCCPTTDGAAAVLLCHEKRAKEFTDKPVYLLATALAVDTWHSSLKSSYIGWPMNTKASNEAYAMAGITPKDISLAELHDCFSCTELITYEDIGFCEKGKGASWLESGGPMPSGEIPCNVSGGLKAKGHPVGATGVAQACEIWWHLRAEAGERQVKNAEIGLTHNLGGSGSICVVNIFGNKKRKAIL